MSSAKERQSLPRAQPPLCKGRCHPACYARWMTEGLSPTRIFFFPLSGAVAPALPKLSHGESQVGLCASFALSLSSAIFLHDDHLRACLSPSRGEVSRSDGEGLFLPEEKEERKTKREALSSVHAAAALSRRRGGACPSRQNRDPTKPACGEFAALYEFAAPFFVGNAPAARAVGDAGPYKEAACRSRGTIGGCVSSRNNRSESPPGPPPRPSQSLKRRYIRSRVGRRLSRSGCSF